MSITESRSKTVTPPTLSDIRNGMRRMVRDDFETVWERTCSGAGISATAVTADAAEMDRLLDGIASYDRMCAVMAMSWRIRFTAVEKLAEIGR